jgi:hypothetical protein
LQKYVEDELSEALIQGEMDGSGTIEVYCGDDKLGFRLVAADDKELTHKT